MRIRGIQQAHNAVTRGRWEAFADHRRQVTEALCALAPQGKGRLGIFGAGNGNDLDLAALCNTFDRIDLIDLDGDALDFAVRQQAVGDRQLFLHADVDLTGVADRLSAWRPEVPAPPNQVERCAEAAMRWTPDLPGGFDVCASIGVLSQLIDGVISTLGQRHPGFLRMMTAIRTRHLRLLLEATRPGGSVFLGADVVSSLTCPQLLNARREELPQIVTRAVETGNFFTGMNPFVLFDALRKDEQLAPLVKSVSVLQPWLWNLGERSYALVPLVIVRNEAKPTPSRS